MKKGRKLTRGILSIVLTAALVVGLMPGNMLTVSAEQADALAEENTGNTKTIAGLGTSVIADPTAPASSSDAWNGSYVYYGNYNSSPVKYRVLDASTTDYSADGTTQTMFLDCDSVLFEYTFESRYGVCANGEINNSINGDGFLNKEGVFTTAEKNAIAASTVTSHPLTTESETGVNVTSWVQEAFENYVALTGEYIFLLDAEDVSNKAYGYSMTDGICENRKKTGSSDGKWWLRSSAVNDTEFLGIVSSGAISNTSVQFFNGGVSPALNLDLSSVLFSSVISGTAGETGAEYKLTLLDGDMTITANGDATRNGKTVTVPYSISGTNSANATQVSVLILDKEYTAGNMNGATVLDYQKLNVDSFSASGTGTFTLPSGLTGTLGTDYHIYLLAEQVNADNSTDYASEPVKVEKIYLDISEATVVQSNTLTYDNTAQTPTFTVTLDNTTLTADDYDVIVTAQTNVGSYTATITGKGNCKGTISNVTWSIGKGTPTAEMFTYTAPAKLVYDGTEKSANVVVKDGITGIGVITNIKYYQNDIEVTPINAGTYTVKIDVAEGDNYVAATNIGVGTFTISKATVPTLLRGSKAYVYNQSYEGELVSITGVPTDCGKVEYELFGVSGDMLENILVDASNGKITYDVKALDSYTEGLATTITVMVKMDNYENAIYALDVTRRDKYAVTVKDGMSVSLETNELIYGQRLGELAFNEVTFVGEAGGVVDGTLKWEDSNEVPDVATDTASWRFIPDSDVYKEVVGTLDITVKQAPLVVEAVPVVADQVYNPSVTLADVALSGGTVKDAYGKTIEGTWSWEDSDTVPTVVNDGYEAVFTPEDGTNYKTKEVDITVSVAKATPYIKTAVAADAITYGATLKNSALSGGVVQYSETDETAVAGSWSWKEVTTKPVVADSNVTQYDVVFTPTDAENYNKVETKITLTVNKAETTPNMPESTMSALYSQKTVGTVELPEGWVWNEADSAKELTVDVAVEATAIYNGADKGNYVTESVTISITRQVCKHAGKTEVKDAKEATCAAEGYTGDTYCKDCGAKIATGTKIDKSTAHTWDNGVVTKEATATEKGEKTYTCKICKATKKEEIPTLGLPQNGAVAKSDTATYKVTNSDFKNGTVSYTGPIDKNETAVTVPDEVVIDGVVFKVTSIEKNAFKGNKKIKQVTIGKNVMTIGDNAFYKCTALTKISIPSKVKTIGKNAFYGCKKMTSATIGKSVSKIGAKAFYGCSKLKTLKIKTTKLTAKKIGSKAFSKTPKSMKVTVPKKKFKTYKSMLIKKGVNKKAKFKKA